MAIAPAYAVVVEFQTDKTSYKKGDVIKFSGNTDIAHSNKMVSVKVYGPDGEFVILTGGRSDQDAILVLNSIDTTKEKTAAKFSQKGIYNATAFYDDEPTYKGKWTIFDYSPDGSPVSPSAAEVMGQQTQTPTQQPTQTPTQQPTQQPTQTPTQQPTQTPTQQEPKCGPGTVLNKDGVCVIGEPEPAPEAEPEPAPEPETSGPMVTHIPGFPDPDKDPQYYIDRYNNEPAYKEWFDRNFPDYTIYQVLGVLGPKKTHIPGFPDPDKDPQYYINRYNSDAEYKAWFDRNFPDDTIYAIVGVQEPDSEQTEGCGPGTHLEDGICILDGPNKQQLLSGCLIATAAYGTELAPQVQQLREIRESTLLATNSGATFLSAFNDAYYSFSPTVADWERQNPAFKALVRMTITPMISTLSILNYVDIDSESEMMGYGIGIILLNIGMYFAAPAFAIIKLKKILCK